MNAYLQHHYRPMLLFIFSNNKMSSWLAKEANRANQAFIIWILDNFGEDRLMDYLVTVLQAKCSFTLL